MTPDVPEGGWAFPVTLDADHGVRRTTDEAQAIRQSLWMILSTAPGERVMRPDFGCGISDLVFGVQNAGTVGSIRAAVWEALVTWEPRVDVLDVSVAPDPRQPNLLLIEINYRMRGSESPARLVYPLAVA